MGAGENCDLGFQLRENEKIGRGEMDSIPTFKSSIRGEGMSSMSMFKSSNGGGALFSSGWSPFSQGHSEFGNSKYPVLMENQGINSSSHIDHYPQSDSCFASGNFSAMVGSLGLQEREDCEISPDGNKRKRVLYSNPNMNSECEQVKEVSQGSIEILKNQDEKIDKNTCTNLPVKQTEVDSQSGEAPKQNYVHMRARRGQATNSHSLAERVRREKISERMRMLQELVPGCNKITGKAVMLDEIINYVQSLQQQVEFLSMKLAAVNPDLNIGLERILSKDILHSRIGGAANLGISSGMNTSRLYPHGITAPQFHPMPQNVWDNEIQSLLQMGYDSNPAVNAQGQNEHPIPEL